MIDVQNLTQVYRSGKGIFDVNFHTKEGEVFGYLGPNGAGKTTTIRNLMGFANATKGHAAINGIDCRRDAAKLQSRIGYLPGEMAFLDNMTGLEFLKFVGDMRGTKDQKRRDRLIVQMELDTAGKIKKMSKGMKQKLGIITAFMHDPDIYILDEPTSGLDPFMQKAFMEILRGEKDRGKTIMMSSHIFEEVQQICDRAGIIREGRIVAIEDVQSLNAMKRETYVVTLSDGKDVQRLLEYDFTAEKLSDYRIQISVHQNYQAVFAALSTCSVVGLETAPQTLENVFMKYYGKDGDKHESTAV